MSRVEELHNKAMDIAEFPSIEIREELKNLYEDINYMRHLSFKGMFFKLL